MDAHRLSVIVIIIGLSLSTAKAKKCDRKLEYKEMTHFKVIQDFVEHCRIKTLTDLLEHFPAELKRRYSLIHHSKALGHASAKFPRIMYSGDQSLLTLSHSSFTKGKDNQLLEMMEFTKDHQFRFQFIEFNRRGLRRAQFSEINPAKCLACHRNRDIGANQPIWGQYPFWPGVYGSMTDKHTFVFDPNGEVPYPTKDLYYPLIEQKAYDQLVKPQIGKKGGFKHLNPQIDDKKERLRFRTGFGPSSDLHDLTNQANLKAFSNLMQEKGIKQQAYRYYIMGIGCLDEMYYAKYPNFKYGDEYSTEEFHAYLKKLLTDDNISKLMDFYARSQGISDYQLDELFAHLKDYIKTSIAQGVQSNIQSICKDHKNLAKSLNVRPDSCEDIKKFMLDDFEGINYLQNGQWAHTALSYLFFKYHGVPYERWWHDRIKLGHYSNNLNFGNDLNQAAFQVFDFKTSDPSLYELLKKNSGSFWPIVGDRVSFAFRLSERPQFKAVCKDIIEAKSRKHTQL
jgi:hypothetical protein